MRQKLICLLLTGVLSFSSFGVFAFADVEGNQFAREIETVSNLGLMTGDETGEFRPDDTLTRAELCSIAMRLTGASGLSLSDTRIAFYDVTGAHWAFDDINAAYILGIVCGDGGRYFYPDNAVTYAEALKMILCALGYQAQAEAVGGYPSGYMAVAAQVKLSKGVPVDGAFTRAYAAKLLYNALSVPYRQMVGFDDEQISYADDGRTVLDAVLHLTESTGRLDAVGPYRITEGKKLKENQAEIDGIVYECQSAINSSLLGYQVTYYYRIEDNGDRTLVHAESRRAVDTLSLTSTQIVDFNDGVLTYVAENGKVRTIAVPAYCNVVLNGQIAPVFSRDDFVTADQIVCIDSDSDGAYDLFRIENAQIIWVSAVDAQEYMIYDKSGTVLTLDESALITVSSGNESGLTFEDIPVESVLQVCVTRSGGREVVDIVICTDTIEGEIQEVETTEWDTVVVVDGRRFEYSKNKEQLPAVKVGEKRVLYLDPLGRIAGIKDGFESNWQYGYLAAYQQFAGINDTLTLKLFSQDNMFIYPVVAETFFFNGQSNDSEKQLKEAFLENPNGMVVKYEQNSMGEIKRLYTAQPHVENSDKNGLYLEFSLADVTYKKNINAFGGKVRMDGSTIIMEIPPANGDFDDPNAYSIRTLDYFDDSSTYTIQAYDCSKVKFAKLLVLETGGATGASIRKDTAFTIVDRIATALDEQGNEVEKLYGMQGGQMVSAIVSDTVTLSPVFQKKEGGIYQSNLEKGDIVRYMLDQSGRISAIEKVLDLDDQDDPALETTGEFTMANWLAIGVSTGVYKPNGHNKAEINSRGYRVVFGTVKEKDGGNLLVRVGEDDQVFDASKMKIYYIDEEEESYGESSVEAIIPLSAVGGDEDAASNVVIRTKDSEMRELFIIKRKRG